MSAPRLLRWLTLLALLLAPLGMIGAGPAMAHGRTAAAGHCSESGSPAKAPSSAPVDCMIACAGLPAQASSPLVKPPLAAAPEPLPAPWRVDGLHPKTTIPPPRHV
jgi:hypothetical protein